MDKQSVDYSAQARTNPVFMTAKTAVCLMAQAGIPDVAEIARRLGLGSAAEVSGMKDSGTLLGNELVVKAKYRTMCGLIEASSYALHERVLFDIDNYLITAPEITGPWSGSVYLHSAGFDASLLHDLHVGLFQADQCGVFSRINKAAGQRFAFHSAWKRP